MLARLADKVSVRGGENAVGPAWCEGERSFWMGSACPVTCAEAILVRDSSIESIESVKSIESPSVMALETPMHEHSPALGVSRA